MKKEKTTITKDTPQYERHDVENTPFSIIKKVDNGKCKIACGMQLVSEEEFSCIEEAQNYIIDKPWELITNVCAIMAHNIYKITNNKKLKNYGN